MPLHNVPYVLECICHFPYLNLKCFPKMTSVLMFSILVFFLMHTIHVTLKVK